MGGNDRPDASGASSTADTEVATSPSAASQAASEADELIRKVARVGDAAPPPARLAAGQVVDGAYRIVRVLGVGGMGVVYLAHDLRLDRDVALKLHSGALGTAGTERLRREAMAMAKLIHAHVVTVYEVGAYEDHPFVVMEYVAGGTARTWLAASKRSSTEILALYVSAGRGLAAAHAAGLVHRDFKPDNVLVGDDGRVRVADFGLARAHNEMISVHTVSGGGPNLPDLTATGAILGTPAYMAPEQHLGHEVDASADQFAFCVALWEALFAQRPFVPDDSGSVREAVVTGKRTAPAATGGVPRHIRRALERGLAPDPDARFPTMVALLGELTRDPARNRRRAAIAVAVLAVAGGVVWLALDRSGGRAASGDPCGGGEARVATIWNPTRRTAVEEAFAKTGKTNAAAIARRATAGVDRYAASWQGERRAACEARPTPELAAAQTACFDRRFDELATSIVVLSSIDAAGIESAVDLILIRPPAAECADPRRLDDPRPPPGDESVVTSVRALVSEAMGRVRVRQLEAAVALTEKAVAATAGDRAWPPLRAEALIARGNVVAAKGDAAAAAADLEAGYDQAMSSSHPDAAIRAAVRLAQLHGQDPKHGVDTARWIQRGLALADGPLADTHHEVMARGTAGIMHQQAGRYAEGLAEGERALAVAQALPGDHAVFLMRAEQTVGTALDYLGRYDESRAHAERALALVEELYGPESPMLAGQLSNLGILMIELGRPSDALLLQERALRISIASRGPRDSEAARIRSRIANIRLARREPDQAIAELEAVIQIIAEVYGSDHPDMTVALSSMSSAYVDRGDGERGLEFARQAFALSDKLYGPGHAYTASTQVNVAVALMTLRRYREALPLLRKSQVVYETVTPDSPELAALHNSLGRANAGLGNHDVAVAEIERGLATYRTHSENPRDTAQTLTLLAQALWNRNGAGDRARARAVATEARAIYERVGAAAEPELQNVDRWLTTRDDPKRSVEVSYLD